MNYPKNHASKNTYSSTVAKCSTHGCDSKPISRGMCKKHYKKWWVENRVVDGYNICSSPSCDGIVEAKRLCHKHYLRARLQERRRNHPVPERTRKDKAEKQYEPCIQRRLYLALKAANLDVLYNDRRTIPGRLEIDILVRNNQEPICAIEVDGPSHFQPIYGGEIFEKTQENAATKDRWCAEHNVPMMRYRVERRARLVLYQEIGEIPDTLVCALKSAALSAPHIVVDCENEPVCQADGCNHLATCLSHQWCEKHYERLRRHGSTEKPVRQITQKRPCSVPGCSSPQRCRGLCALHYGRLLRTGQTEIPERAWNRCSVAGCSHQARSRGSRLCANHYAKEWRKRH